MIFQHDNDDINDDDSVYNITKHSYVLIIGHKVSNRNNTSLILKKYISRKGEK